MLDDDRNRTWMIEMNAELRTRVTRLYTCAAKSASLTSLVGRDFSDTASRMVNTISRNVVTSSSASDQPCSLDPTRPHAHTRHHVGAARGASVAWPCSERRLGLYMYVHSERTACHPPFESLRKGRSHPLNTHTLAREQTTHSTTPSLSRSILPGARAVSN